MSLKKRNKFLVSDDETNEKIECELCSCSKGNDDNIDLDHCIDGFVSDRNTL